jgi:serine/threonine protein kinase
MTRDPVARLLERHGSSSEWDSAGSGPSQVTLALKEYLAALEAGERPDREAFLQRYPVVAGELAVCLENLEFIRGTAARLAGGPSGDDPVSSADGDASPEPIGDFRILRTIGRGGMGVVYEAEQMSLNRRVALKVLPFAAALDPRQLQRFKNEAQSAAQLHHTNIVPIYAVGCERGVHYYAMQYIDGRSLAAVIKELRQFSKGRDSEPTMTYLRSRWLGDESASLLGLAVGRGTSGGDRPEGQVIPSGAPAEPEQFYRRVALLGIKAAEALDHAHQMGVVHRDVKPGNLLLDAAGNLWVTDFGLALFHTNPALTITGEVVGTLRYMSPEQALGRRGVIDQRTDIYSLGATLYEWLTLHPVFATRDRQKLMRQVAFDDPLPPRRRDRCIPVELETIILKALAKDPAERYATAQEFAEDLRCFLQDRPIQARRPTLPMRALKWARRHRSIVTTACVTLALLVVGSVVSTCLIAREHYETKAAYERELREAEEAKKQRARAERSARQARCAVDFFTRLGEEEMSNTPFVNGVRRRMLEAALSYYQEFIDEAEGDPRLQSELTASRQRVKSILGELSALEGAGEFMLLGDRSVQDDLELTREQRDKVKALAEGITRHWRDAVHNLGELGQEDRRRRIIELAQNTEAALPQLLTPEQGRRLKQILIQVRAPHSFSSPEVAEVLQLTPAQKERIRGIQDDLSLAKWNYLQPEADRSALRKKIDEMKRNACEQILRTLTAEQRAAWRNLTGAPFRPGAEL